MGLAHRVRFVSVSDDGVTVQANGGRILIKRVRAMKEKYLQWSGQTKLALLLASHWAIKVSYKTDIEIARAAKKSRF